MHRSTWPVRLLRATAFATVIAGSFAGHVSAKIPFFSVETSPTEPIAGEPILLVVRFWVDANHTDPALFDAEPTMGRLLVIRPADAGAPEIAVPLKMRRPGIFEARVTLQPGDWLIVAFPDRTGWATAAVPVGYPDTIPLTVREPRGDPGTAVLLEGIALLLVAAALRLRLPPFQLGGRFTVRRQPEVD